MEKFLKEIDDNTLNNFVNNHQKEHFMQTAQWGKVKQSLGNWTYKCVGYYENNKIKGTALLLFRKIPIINSFICYAPRGYVIDYKNENLLKNFTSLLVDYCKKKRVCYIQIDPDLYYCVKNKKNEIIEQNKSIISILKKIGYNHRGFNKGFESTQPRYTYRLYLNNEKEEIFNNFSKIVRSSIRNATDAGIECSKTNNIEDFYNILQDTANRKSFLENKKEYYSTVYNIFKESKMATCYIAKYYPYKHLIFLNSKKKNLLKEQKNLENLLNDNSKKEKYLNREKEILIQLERINKLLKLAQTNMNLYPNGIILSSGITINTKNRAWLVYGGNSSILRDIGANYKIKDFEINDDIKKHFEFIDFFGTCSEDCEQDDLKGIHDFKKKFGGYYIEFPGEFHYVLKPISYKIWISLYPRIVSILKKFKNHKKRSNIRNEEK